MQSMRDGILEVDIQATVLYSDLECWVDRDGLKGGR